MLWACAASRTTSWWTRRGSCRPSAPPPPTRSGPRSRSCYDPSVRRSGRAARSVGEGPPVAARIGAGHQHAGGWIAPDDLDGARAVEVAEEDDPMAASGQLGADLGREAGLEIQRVGAVVGVVGFLAPLGARPAGRLGRLLGIETEVDQGRQHLEI